MKKDNVIFNAELIETLWFVKIDLPWKNTNRMYFSFVCCGFFLPKCTGVVRNKINVIIFNGELGLKKCNLFWKETIDCRSRSFLRRL